MTGAYERPVSVCSVPVSYRLGPQRSLAKQNEDREFILNAVGLHSDALQYASAELRADRGFVLHAVGLRGCALAHASHELRGDRQVILAAVDQDSTALRYALGAVAKELWADRDVVIQTVRHDGFALWYAAEELRSDTSVVLEAVKQHGCALKLATPKLRADKTIALAAVKQDSDALPLVGAELLGDMDIILAAVKQDRTGVSARASPPLTRGPAARLRRRCRATERRVVPTAQGVPERKSRSGGQRRLAVRGSRAARRQGRSDPEREYFAAAIHVSCTRAFHVQAHDMMNCGSVLTVVCFLACKLHVSRYRRRWATMAFDVCSRARVDVEASCASMHAERCATHCSRGPGADGRSSGLPRPPLRLRGPSGRPGVHPGGGAAGGPRSRDAAFWDVPPSASFATSGCIAAQRGRPWRGSDHTSRHVVALEQNAGWRQKHIE